VSILELMGTVETFANNTFQLPLFEVTFEIAKGYAPDSSLFLAMLGRGTTLNIKEDS
jgi:hypothetical protein